MNFWYYVLFPLAWLSFAQPIRKGRSIIYLALFVLVLVLLGKGIASYFPIWLLGTAIVLLPEIPSLKREYSFLTKVLAMFAFCSIVAACHTTKVRALLNHSVVAADYITAVAFAAMMYWMLHDQSTSNRNFYSRFARWLSGFSYTLYVTHIPLIVFLRAAIVPNSPWSPDALHIAFGIGISIACLIYAYVLSIFTEARTPVVRDRLLRFRQSNDD